jgi:hypothetical protein
VKLFETGIERSAELSPCGKYRYQLWRWWDRDGAAVAFVGLNPSTADANQDDQTIRRCIRFARDWNFGGMVMLNLFAFRTTYPEELRGPPDVNGPQNDFTLSGVRDSGIVPMFVACWGDCGFPERAHHVREMFEPTGLYHLGLTKHGHPKHPARLRADTIPQLWVEIPAKE